MDDSIEGHSVIGVYLSEEDAWKATRITLEEFAAHHRIEPSPAITIEGDSDKSCCDDWVEELNEECHWPDNDEPFTISVSVCSAKLGKMPASRQE
jgi:hypothetical protein